MDDPKKAPPGELMPDPDTGEVLPSEPQTLTARPSRESLEQPDRDVLRDRTRELRTGAPVVASRVSVAMFLRKFCEVGLMASFLGAVLAYHLQFPPEWVARFGEWLVDLNGGNPVVATPGYSPKLVPWILKDLIPFISGGVPILELKVAVWLMVSGLVVVGHLIGRLWEKGSGERVFAQDRSPRIGRGRDWFRLVPTIAIMAFLGWSFMSFQSFGWGPQPAEEFVSLADDGDESWSSCGGSYQSMVSFIQVAAALLFFLVAEDLFRTRRLAYKVLAMIAVLGVIAAVWAVLLQMKLEWLYIIWQKWTDNDYRNDVGGFIGHNTSLSAFLVTPLLLLWTFMMCRRERLNMLHRCGIFACMTMLAMALLLAQSRSVIPNLILTFPLLLILLARRASLKPGITFWVAVPLVLGALILTQLIETESNPFYRRNLPLADRLSMASVGHVHKETRFRILRVSLPVIGEHLLQGTGWGSFQYVYPLEQGLFYEDNPDTDIVPTSLRTSRAHNEYLQTLMETGLVGTAFGLTAVIVILIGGWKTLSSSLNRHTIAIQLAVFVSIVALLLHCAADFPLRVPPVAATLLMLLAIWSAGDRLWLVKVPPLEERLSEEAESMEATMIAAPPDIRQGRRWVLVALPGVLFAALAVYFAAGIRASNWMATNIAVQDATVRVNTIADVSLPPLQEQEQIAAAFDSLKTAKLLTPLFGEIYMLEALTHLNLARLLTGEKEQLAGVGDPKQIEGLRLNALGQATRGVALVNRSLGELRTSSSYRNRGMLFHLMFQNETAPIRREYVAQAFADLERAAKMNPGDASTIAFLVRNYPKDLPGAKEKILRLKRTLYRFHPEQFRSTVMENYYENRFLLENEAAYRALDEVVEVDPANIDFQVMRAQAAYYSGRPDEARQILSKLPTPLPLDGSVLQAQLFVREGSLERALRVLATQVQTDNSYVKRFLRLFGSLIEARLPDRDREAALRRIEEFGQEFPQILGEAGMFLLFEFQDPWAAENYVRRRVAMKDPAPDIQSRVLLARILLAQEAQGLRDLRAAREEARAAGTELPVAEGRLRECLQDAYTQYQAAYKQAPKTIQRQILAPHIADLKALLEEKS